MLVTGPLMLSSDTVNYLHNRSPQFKMGCLYLALVFHLTMQPVRSVPRRRRF